MQLTKKIFWFIFALLTFYVVLQILSNATKIEYVKAYEEPQLTTKDYFILYGNKYNVDPELLYDVMMCESSGEVTSKGDGGRSRSYFQYFDETWKRYSKKYNETYGTNDTFDLWSIHDNVKLTAFAFSLGEDARREWTTYRALKNGGVYSFYSRVNKRHYTVYCDANDYSL